MIKFSYEDKISSSSPIDLTPLIDMVFQLLIFFMLTASTASAFQVSAKGNMAKPTDQKQILFIEVSVDGTCRIDGKVLDKSDLTGAIRLSSTGKSGVALEVNNQTTYETLNYVMQSVQASGIQNIYFADETKKPAY